MTCSDPQWGRPYSERTFNMVFSLRHDFAEFSKRLDVPIIAIAGSVADEYDTQEGIKGAIDWVQDNFISLLPSWSIIVDERLNFRTKLLNATINDIGIGNIKLETAKQFFPDMPWEELVDLILTDRGTIAIAAMVIRQAVERLRPHVQGLSDAQKEAAYVTYYKQGESYIQRYAKRSAAEPPGSDSIAPGEGCRVLRQRHRFAQVLSVR